MMGSRGDASPQLAALTLLAELVALLKGADGTLGIRLAELQAEEERVAANTAALASAEAEHRQRTQALEERHGELDQREAALVEREQACAARVSEVTRRQASFDDQAAALAAREGALVGEREKLAQSAREFADTCSAERAVIAGEKQQAKDEIARQRQQAATAAQEAEATHAASIRRMHEVADTEIARQQRELVQREVVLATREQAIRDRAAELSAVLGS